MKIPKFQIKSLPYKEQLVFRRNYGLHHGANENYQSAAYLTEAIAILEKTKDRKYNQHTDRHHIKCIIWTLDIDYLSKARKDLIIKSQLGLKHLTEVSSS